MSQKFCYNFEIRRSCVQQIANSRGKREILYFRSTKVQRSTKKYEETREVLIYSAVKPPFIQNFYYLNFRLKKEHFTNCFLATINYCMNSNLILRKNLFLFEH